MIKLRTKKSEPLRLPLGDAASILYRPLTAIEREAALAKSREFIEEARAGIDAFARYGFAGSSEWIDDSELALGVGTFVLHVEMAVRVFISWEGIGDEAGNALPLTRENIAALMRDPIIYPVVQKALLRPLHDLDAEGNASAPSPNGAPAGAKNTAQGAQESKPPAPADGQASTESAAQSTLSP
jgi:hypothetical protein